MKHRTSVVSALIAATLAAVVPTLAQAHEGHGLAGASHWHVTDAWGFIAGAAVIAAAIWFSGRDQ